MNIFKIRQHLNEIERLQNQKTARIGITAEDIKDDIEYQKQQILTELEAPAEIQLEETAGIFSPGDFEELTVTKSATA